MSDLQCPARFLVARPGEPADDLAGRLSGERVAAVYTNALAPVRQAATAVADRLGLPVWFLDGADELSASLDGLADRHRGETVVVVSDACLGSGLAVVEVDADGWRVGPWPGGGATRDGPSEQP